MNEHNVGIIFTAKARMQEIADVVKGLDGIDGKSQKLINTLLRLGNEGSAGIRELANIQDELTEAVERSTEKGKKATDEEIKNIKRLEQTKKEYAATLKAMQQQGVDPYASQISGIVDQLEKRAVQYDEEGRPGSGKNAEALRLTQRVGKQFIGEDKAATNIMSRAGTGPSGAGEPSGMMAGLMGGMIGGAGKLLGLLGLGTLAGKAAGEWISYDRAMKKVEARFGTLGTAATKFRRDFLEQGVGLGYKQQQLGPLYSKFLQINRGAELGDDTDQFNQMVGFGRATGITNEEALQVSLMSGRYLNAEKVNFKGFEDFASRTGMRARLDEMIPIMSQMSQMAMQVKYNPLDGGVSPGAVYEAISNSMFPDHPKGEGFRNLEYAQRLHRGLQSTGAQDVERLKMRAAGLGSRNMEDVFITMESGLFGKVPGADGDEDKSYMQAVMEQIEKEVGDNPNEFARVAKRVFGGQLTQWEIKRLRTMSGDDKQNFYDMMMSDENTGTEEERVKRSFGRTSLKDDYSDYLKKGRSHTPIAEQVTQMISNATISVTDGVVSVFRTDDKATYEDAEDFVGPKRSKKLTYEEAMASKQRQNELKQEYHNKGGIVGMAAYIREALGMDLEEFQVGSTRPMKIRTQGDKLFRADEGNGKIQVVVKFDDESTDKTIAKLETVIGSGNLLDQIKRELEAFSWERLIGLPRNNR